LFFQAAGGENSIKRKSAMRKNEKGQEMGENPHTFWGGRKKREATSLVPDLEAVAGRKKKVGFPVDQGKGPDL